MAQELILEKWSSSVSQVFIGATKEEGGTRGKTIKVGGQAGLPFLFAEGVIPNPAVVAFEVWDIFPADWPDSLVRAYSEKLLKDPLAWARQCVDKYGAELICLRLQGAHPDSGDRAVDEEVKLVNRLLKEVSVPLIILGSGDDAKDNQLMPAVCEAAKGERCLIGSAVQDNYKTLAAAALADGHNLIAESPIDINIAKQLNILISDMGLPLDRIVINPTIGALGYGLEYAYSIMERARLAALAGDKSVASPFICFVAQESWRAKEARAPQEDFSSWGDQAKRGIAWETITAASLIQAGADILVMRHPQAVEEIRGYINELMNR
ncbi:MAG: acetyl-CoA decarbonylase/synthase complex subunit delta [Candidatus Omnitrophica bacterium]|nr:acetyl-CoA decarbonylase/synthase complex subunit delta [Candidatus Omnitrophota bacterium]